MEYVDFNKKEKTIYWILRIFITFTMLIVFVLIIDGVYTKFGDIGFISLVFVAGLGSFLQGIIKLTHK